jgi:phage anti-repressor protein
MDKLREIMEKMGMKPELVNQLCEAMQTHLTEHKTRLDTDFETRIAAAKKVCIHETEQHKAELARRLQIFCEATVQKIENQVTRQVASRDGEAKTKLDSIWRMLEGIGDDAAAKAQIESIQKKLHKITEERDAAIRKANAQTDLAEKVLQRNRSLERRISTMEGGERPTKPAPQPIRSTVTEGKQSVRRLDGERSSGRAQTTRPTLRENNDMRSEPAPHNPVIRETTTLGSSPTPADIAESIEEGMPT